MVNLSVAMRRRPCGVALCIMLALTACGGGGSSAPPAPVPSVQLSSSTQAVYAGGGRIALTAKRSAIDAGVQWRLADGAVGKLIGDSGDNVVYAPPATLARDTTVTVTASGGGVTRTIDLTVRASLRLALIAGQPYPAAGEVTTPFKTLQAVAAAPDGSLYVSDFQAFATTFRIDPQGRISEAFPLGLSTIVFDAGGRMYAAPFSASLSPGGAVEVLPSGETLRLTYFSFGSYGYNTQLALTRDGVFYGEDPARNRIQKWRKGDPAGTVGVIGECVNAVFADSTLMCQRTASQDGDAKTARFGSVAGGLVAGPNNEVYVGDGISIRKILATDQVTTLVVGKGGDIDGPAAAADMDAPQALTVDSTGNLYALSATAVRKIAADGAVTTLAKLDADNRVGDGQRFGLAYREVGGVKSLVISNRTSLRELFLP